ncbi:MAG: hypothetical protein KBA31_08145 [Alphaproteobacteria bacterium]|nr:hypothetical protein [Alphaproteobacteria bacterium]
MKSVAVVYLSRRGNPARMSRGFLQSLAANPAGSEFELIFLLKGFSAEESDPEFDRLKSTLRDRASLVRISDEGFDLNAYRKVSAGLAHERILFLNSHSRILAPAWLRHYLNAFDRIGNCGVVGATGSFETIPGTTFPNITIRTNAFMMDRELFLDLDPGQLATKPDANRFEAGAASLTAQLLQRGLQPVVVDRNGRAWLHEEWPLSATFRSGQQEGLLVADNRTHDYDRSSLRRRRKLARLAWGDAASPPRAPVLRRLQSELAWRWPRA